MLFLCRLCNQKIHFLQVLLLPIGRCLDFTPALALTICGKFQKSKLPRFLLKMEKGYRDDGMLQRFMWVCPQSNSFEDAYSTGFRGVNDSMFSQIQNIFARLDALSPNDVGATNSDYSPAPWILLSLVIFTIPTIETSNLNVGSSSLSARTRNIKDLQLFTFKNY